jgi:hypothetical protein
VGDGIGLSLSDRRNYRVDIESVSGWVGYGNRGPARTR